LATDAVALFGRPARPATAARHAHAVLAHLGRGTAHAAAGIQAKAAAGVATLAERAHDLVAGRRAFAALANRPRGAGDAIAYRVHAKALGVAHEASGARELGRRTVVHACAARADEPRITQVPIVDAAIAVVVDVV